MLIILVRKALWISLRNNDIIVKILNTVKYQVFQNVCNVVCFSYCISHSEVFLVEQILCGENHRDFADFEKNRRRIASAQFSHVITEIWKTNEKISNNTVVEEKSYLR